MGQYFLGRVEELSRIRGRWSPGGVVVVVGLPGTGKTELGYQLERGLRGEHASIVRVVLEPGVGAVGACARALGGDDADTAPVVSAIATRAALLVLDRAELDPAGCAAVVDAAVRAGLGAGRLLVLSRVALPLQTVPTVVRLSPLDEAEGIALVRHFADRLGTTVTAPELISRRAGGVPQRIRSLVAGVPAAAEADPIVALIAALPAASRALLGSLCAIQRCSRARILVGLFDPGGADITRLEIDGLVERRGDELQVPDVVRDLVEADLAPGVVDARRGEAAMVLWAEFERAADPSVAIEAVCLTLRAGQRDLARERLRQSYPAIRRGGLLHLAEPLLAGLTGPGPIGGDAGDDAFAETLQLLIYSSRLNEAAALLAPRAQAEPTRPRVQLLVAAVATRRLELGQARAALARAAEAAEPDQRASIVLGQALLAALTGDLEEAERSIRRIEAAEAERGQAGARVHRVRAVVNLIAHRWQEVLDSAALASAALPHVPQGFDEIDLLRLLAHDALGHLAQVRELGGRRIERWRGGPRSPLQALLVGVVSAAEGASATALAALTEARVAAATGGDELLATFVTDHQARVLLRHGDAMGALDLVRPLVPKLRAAGLPALAATAQVVQARALLALGQLAAATGALDEAGELGGTSALASRALAHAFFGATLAARPLIERALAEAPSSERAAILVDQGYVEVLGGDPERARAAALGAMALGFPQVDPYVEARASLVLAVADLCAGLYDGAVAALARAEELARRHGFPQVQRLIDLLRASQELRSGILDQMSPGHRGGLIGLLRVLGLRGETLVVSTPQGLLHTDAAGVASLSSAFDLVVDTTTNNLLGPRGRAEGRPTVTAILSTLAAAEHEALPADRLYRQVWGAPEYHPLRNRNTLYVALGRVRNLLQQIGEAREVIRRVGDGWALNPDVKVAIVRRDPRVSTVIIAPR
ncbi:MAG: winged helix-turn-helix domain-containing protein [Kofleriaceae bacterium]|nr:winged helix-turn-helix domain-containing protein [Kofleriaceae bacterium]